MQKILMDLSLKLNLPVQILVNAILHNHLLEENIYKKKDLATIKINLERASIQRINKIAKRLKISEEAVLASFVMTAIKDV